MKLSYNQVLIYKKGRTGQARAKRYYMNWRQNQNPPLPARCDIPECFFFDNANVWNGKELNFILDHMNGVSGDNRIENLRLLCPNCNSQQTTSGGRNKGRVKQDDASFSVYQDGITNSIVPVPVAVLNLSANDVKINYNKK